MLCFLFIIYHNIYSNNNIYLKSNIHSIIRYKFSGLYNGIKHGIHINTNTNNFILDIKYGTISVTIIYINKHDSRLNPGNRYKDICRGTSVTVRLPGQ